MLQFRLADGAQVIDFQPLLRQLQHTQLRDWLPDLQPRLNAALVPGCHGDFEKWAGALDRLPDSPATNIVLDQAAIRVDTTQPDRPSADLAETLDHLHPWRKGPFHVHGVDIDTEWRSDWKWNRVASHLDDLNGRLVLDVGCGNGYHCWRMAGAGARLVIGIDPTILFVMQFFALRHFVGDDRVWVLPLGIEQLPGNLSGFDTVFSMGVLYHRRSPIEHLQRLATLLRPGGQLVLETLVIPGGEGQVLVPEGRYARMRNVWFLPSVALLERWLRRCRYTDVHCVDVTETSIEEQRSTRWMRFESLQQCLDPADPTKTIEGHPSPRRAMLTARTPE